MNEEKKKASWLTPFSRESLFFVCFSLGLLAAALIYFKAAKLQILTGGALWLQPFRWSALFLHDLFGVIVLGILFLLWLESERPLIRGAGRYALDGAVWCFLLLAAIEHQFFLTTRTLISAEMMLYGLRQLGMLSSLLWGQLTLWHLLALLIPMGWAFLPRYLLRRPAIRARLLAPQKERSFSSPAGMMLLTVFLLAAQVFLPLPKEAEILVLRENLFVRWLREGREGMQLASAERKRLDQGKEALFSAQGLHFLPTPQTRRPNLVVIVLESIRHRSTTLADPRLQTMPFLASLAKDGLLVEQMYPVVPHTSKAVASIFCGIYPKIAMQVVESEIDGIPARCLPSLLEPLGYKSAIFHPATARFENYDQLARNVGFSTIRVLEDLDTEGFFRTNYFGYEDRILLKPSFAWLDQIKKEKQPFFLAYHTLTSHHGYTTPPHYPRRDLGAKRGTEYDDYLQSLRYTDDFIREVFAGFEKRGLMEDTVFLFVSDHGEAFGEHGLYQHGNGMWEEIVHIPALLYNRKLFPKGGKIKGLRQQIDILPTIADILRVSIQGGVLPGKSFFQEARPDRTIWMTCWFEKHCMALRQGRYKMIYNYNRRPMLAYDLARDPLEREDVASSPALQPILEKAKEKMLAWKAAVNRVYEQPSRFQWRDAITRHPPKIDRATEAMLGSWLRVVGYRLHTPTARPGEAFEISFLFQAKKPIPPEWQLFFHLDVKEPSRFLNLDHLPVSGRYPLSLWKEGEYILDRYRFYLPADFPPHAEFTISLGLWSTKAHKRASVLAKMPPTQMPKDGRLPILTSKIHPPRWRAGRPPVQLLLDARFDDLLRLVGYNLHTPAPQSAEIFDITLVYYIQRPIPQGWKLYFHFQQDRPTLFFNADRAIPPDTKPLSQWTAGRYHTLRLRYRLPPALMPGAKLLLYTGIWHPNHPYPRLHGPQDSVKQDLRGRLLVLTKTVTR